MNMNFKNRRIIVLLVTFFFLNLMFLIPNSQSFSSNISKTNDGDGVANRYALLIGTEAYYTDNNVNGF